LIIIESDFSPIGIGFSILKIFGSHTSFHSKSKKWREKVEKIWCPENIFDSLEGMISTFHIF